VDVNETLTVNEAVAKLLNPSEEEQVKEETLEQETLEEETQEVTTENEDEEVEVEVEEDTEVETEEDDGDVEVGDSDEVEEESEAQEMTTESDLYTVKVDGEEYEVNLEELKKGYQLEQNYTKRVHKELDTLKTNLNAERQQYLQLMELAATNQMAEVNKAKELLGTIDKEADPVSYVKQQLRVQEIEDNLRQSVAGFQQAKAQADQQQQEQRAKIVHQEQEKLSSLIPEWVSPDFQKAVVDYAKAQGYSDSDLSNVISARDVSVINKARLYDELVSKKATVKKKRQPVVKKKVKSKTPASAQTRKARAVKEQRQKLKSSGKVTDAANAILSLTS
jgi:hypothetical protein